MPKDIAETDVQLPSGLLIHQAAHSAGVLLTWAHQRPEQLAAALQCHGASVQVNTPAGIWSDCIDILFVLFGTYRSTAKSAVAWSQQLEMSSG
jgi:hypothetical protein